MAATRRSSFGVVLLGGLATAGLMAVAASQTWMHVTGDDLVGTRRIEVSGSDAAPLALALALVALAGWGVVLVSGTRARRIASVIGLLASLGVVAVAVTVLPDPEGVAKDVLTNQPPIDGIGASLRPWFWVTVAAAAAQVVVLVAAFRAAPGWPTMSSRYDAPGARGEVTSDTAEESAPLGDLDLWKAMDEGRDPTGPPSP